MSQREGCTGRQWITDSDVGKRFRLVDRHGKPHGPRYTATATSKQYTQERWGKAEWSCVTGVDRKGRTVQVRRGRLVFFLLS